MIMLLPDAGITTGGLLDVGFEAISDRTPLIPDLKPGISVLAY